MVSISRRAETGAAGRAVLVVAAMAVVASAAFSIGEVRGARHRSQPATSASVPSGISGLSVGRLERLEKQVEHAKALVQSQSDDSITASLSQLEQQFGISPSSPTASQLQQLQAELDAINACLSGSNSGANGC